MLASRNIAKQTHSNEGDSKPTYSTPNGSNEDDSVAHTWPGAFEGAGGLICLLQSLPRPKSTKYMVSSTSRLACGKQCVCRWTAVEERPDLRCGLPGAECPGMCGGCWYATRCAHLPGCSCYPQTAESQPAPPEAPVTDSKCSNCQACFNLKHVMDTKYETSPCVISGADMKIPNPVQVCAVLRGTHVQ